MPPKLTHEFVQAAFDAAGYTLLSQYELTTKKLDFICPKGHRHSIAWGHFQKGKRCAHCKGKIVSHEQVQAVFESEGYTLLSQYKNSSTKLDFICPNGHKHKIAWGSFRSGTRCIHCKFEVATKEQVRQTFEARGYQLLTEYRNQKVKLDFICPNGHTSSIGWNYFKRGSECSLCSGRLISLPRIHEEFAKRGLTPLTPYINSTTPMEFTCSRGHKDSVSWVMMMHENRGCRWCSGQFMTLEERAIKNEIEKIGEALQRQIGEAARNKSFKVNFSKHIFAKKIARQMVETIGFQSKGYHIDHLVPQSFFDLRNEHELLACWSPCNLRYLTLVENSRRCNKLTLEEVKNFTSKQMEVFKIASRKPIIWQEYLGEST